MKKFVAIALIWLVSAAAQATTVCVVKAHVVKGDGTVFRPRYVCPEGAASQVPSLVPHTPFALCTDPADSITGSDYIETSDLIVETVRPKFAPHKFAGKKRVHYRIFASCPAL